MGGEPVGVNSAAKRIRALSGERRAALGALLRRGSGEQYSAIPRLGQTENVPLSFGQQRLWFLDQWRPGNPAYNVPAIFPLSQPVDVEAARRTLEEIGRRHASLRTRFRVAGGEPVQDVLPNMLPEFRSVAIPAGSAREREQEIPRLVNEEIRRPFDLQHGPLFRAALFPKNQSECILVLTMHHIVADGWSVGLLFQEFKAVYGAFRNALPSPLEELPIQYTDFAIWQREYLGGNSLENQTLYWRSQLADAPILELPSTTPRRPEPTHRGALQSILIPTDLRDQLRELARAESSTMYMVLLAAFIVLMHRYTSQQDIIIGSPVAGRSRPQTERLIGFFVNTLAIRVNVGGLPSFRHCLGRVRKVVIEALAHQDLPFERLVQELKLDRDLSRNPLFQVTFQLFTGPEPANRQESTAPGPIEIEKGTSLFDLAFNLWESIRGIEGRIEYSTDLFDQGYTTRMSGHFVTLLRSIATHPDRPIAELNMLMETEREEILFRWNDTQVEIEDERCIHELVEEQAKYRPHEYAVIGGDVRLTYAELNGRANEIARRLQELGVVVETPVAVCLDRSPGLIAVLLGILKSGGAYVPIDSGYPMQRLSFMVRDSGAKVLITNEFRVPDLPAIDTQVLCIDQIAADSCDQTPRRRVARFDTLAYVIYTSGSTGTPKGVEVEHRALRNLVDWHRRTYQVVAQDRATQVASISFDAAVWEIWPHLAAGSCICIADDDTRADPDRLLSWLMEQRINLCFLPTPLAEAVLMKQLPSALSLRALLTGGDRLHCLSGRKPPFEFNNHYGPTENTVVATFAAVTAGGETRNPTIGRPISNNQIYILDVNMQPVPIGIPGEIHIGGASLARGYRNRAELTAERFVANPFDARRASRLYKSGDLARFREDGEVEFLGRTDRQLKIRGFRIEPGEVEAVLRGCPGIGEVMVTANQGAFFQQQLVAYYVWHAHKERRDLWRYLKERLPDYMIPAAFVELDSMPLTPSGKIDERALPKPLHAGTVEEKAEPRNALEEVLAGIWAEVLGVNVVGLHDNFFTDCGGHSLLSVSLVSHIREALQTDLSLRTIFEAPTIRQLAERMLAEPVEGRRIEAVAKLFLQFLDTLDEGTEGSLSGTEGVGH